MAFTDVKLKKLFKELGDLDRKRKEVLNQIRQNPVYGEHMIRNFFEEKIKETDVEKGTGLYIYNDKDGFGQPLSKIEKIFFLESLISVVKTKQGTDTFVIKYKTSTLKGQTIETQMGVTISRPLENQIFQSATLLSLKEVNVIKKELSKYVASMKELKELAEAEKQMKVLELRINALKKKLTK
jgi:hypothetical protein